MSLGYDAADEGQDVMGIVSIGRSLVLRQALFVCLLIALGGYATVATQQVAEIARGAGAAAAQAASTNIAIATVVCVGGLLAISLPLMHLTFGKPLKAMADALEGLAAGDLSLPIEGADRDDEIGRSLRALLQLRDNAAATRAQTEAARTEMAGAAKADARDTAMALRVEAFSQEIAAKVQRVGSMSKRLGEAAEMMVTAARNASNGSDHATSASTNAAGDVSSVATASEQLLDSIEEISRQVVQSTNVVKDAVERAVATNAGMGRLSTAAQKVGDVVSLISRIAAQTNLLALNATIEAARAGEAGRGFAVVAQEVKTLATQTAKATQDITGQIAEMQEATDLSVEAIDRIQTKISEVEHISTIIAAAVHEQGAATQEIARNVRSAAAGTQTMSSQIENVVRSVGETSASATSVVHLARELDEIATGMASLVNGFSQTTRAA